MEIKKDKTEDVLQDKNKESFWKQAKNNLQKGTEISKSSIKHLYEDAFKRVAYFLKAKTFTITSTNEKENVDKVVTLLFDEKTTSFYMRVDKKEKLQSYLKTGSILKDQQNHYYRIKDANYSNTVAYLLPHKNKMVQVECYVITATMQ